LEQGQYEEAAKCGERIVAKLARAFGPNDQKTLAAVNTLHNATKAYLDSHWYEEAAEWSKHVAAICKRTLGSDHREIAMALIGQATAVRGSLDPIHENGRSIPVWQGML
jgi:hypothetical protein